MFSAVQAERFPSDLCCKAGWLILDILQDTGRGERKLPSPGTFNTNCNASDLQSTRISSARRSPAEQDWTSGLDTERIILDLKCQHLTEDQLL